MWGVLTSPTPPYSAREVRRPGSEQYCLGRMSSVIPELEFKCCVLQECSGMTESTGGGLAVAAVRGIAFFASAQTGVGSGRNAQKKQKMAVLFLNEQDYGSSISSPGVVNYSASESSVLSISSCVIPARLAKRQARRCCWYSTRRSLWMSSSRAACLPPFLCTQGQFGLGDAA